MCLEKRAFYRAISGLHTSINIHLSAQYLLSGEYKYSHLPTKNKSFIIFISVILY